MQFFANKRYIWENRKVSGIQYFSTVLDENVISINLCLLCTEKIDQTDDHNIIFTSIKIFHFNMDCTYLNEFLFLYLHFYVI